MSDTSTPDRLRVEGAWHVHVNRQFIARSAKAGRTDIPTLIVRPQKGRGRVLYCRAVHFVEVKGILGGPGVLPPLDCGARTYHAIEGILELEGAMSFGQARELFESEPAGADEPVREGENDAPYPPYPPCPDAAEAA